MSDYAQLQADYARVFPHYERLAARIEALLRDRLKADGLRLAEVVARPKDPSSFVKKALRKGYDDPMAEIGDKAGARVVVPFARDKERVRQACDRVLVLTEQEDKRELLGSDRIGYAGLHYVAQVRAEYLDAGDEDLGPLRAELQIHTKAESAWATAAHDSLYKSVVDVPDATARRLMRLSVLAEIFDDEVEHFLVELARQPGFAELETIMPGLDHLLLRFTPGAGDQGISALLVPALRTLYDAEPGRIVPNYVEPYVVAHERELQELYARHDGDTRANPLLYQPEVLMFFERLDADPYRLLGVWPALLDVELLERLAILRNVRLR